MNISLTPHFEEMVKNKLASGSYHSASEVIRDALRLLEERDNERSIKLEELRKQIQLGIDSGEPKPMNIENIKARGRKKLTAMKKKS
ncbi:MAG: type II toxin-antitoxin system ParD family antitoxin [Pseudomonadota bacterium]